MLGVDDTKRKYTIHKIVIKTCVRIVLILHGLVILAVTQSEKVIIMSAFAIATA